MFFGTAASSNLTANVSENSIEDTLPSIPNAQGKSKGSIVPMFHSTVVLLFLFFYAELFSRSIAILIDNNINNLFCRILFLLESSSNLDLFLSMIR